MSGDVQPRKRKDKKKRKDEDGYSSLNDDVNIHVHKEGGTGGNICAKIVFFFLFSALIVLIGLIIKENQGLSEIEEFETESRYSQIFDGWVDKSPEDHEDDHSPELSHEHEDHEHEEDEDEHYESEEETVEETEEEPSEEEVEDEEDDQEEEEEDSQARSEEEATEETEEVAETEEDNTVEDDEENTEEVDEQSESQEKDKEESEEVDEDIADASKVDDDDEDEDERDSESKKELSEEEKSIEKSEEDGTTDKSEEDRTTDKSEEDVKEDQEDIEQKQEKSEEVEAEDKKDKQDKKEETLEAKGEEGENVESVKENSGMATKIGVGVALLAVAYNVFFRKRNTDPSAKLLTSTSSSAVYEKEPTPDLSRRNTLVPPLTLQEVEPDLPENEGDEEEYSDEEYSDEDSRSEHRSPREEYQELRSTYTRSMTPEGDFDAKDTHYEEEVLEHNDDIEEEEEIEEEELAEEEIEDDYDRYDDDEDEDEELLKRLEAKYGKLGRDVNVAEEQESESDKEDYEHSNVTNQYDYKIKEEIDAAEEHLTKNAAYANKLFEALLEKYPLSPRSLHGKAKALDVLAEERQSNELLQRALSYYLKVLNAPDVPDPLFVVAAERYIDRARFIGQYKKAIAAHWQLIERFPDNPKYLNTLAVTYLTINLVEEARAVLNRVLSRWPNDGFALVHYGFVLKTADNNLEESVLYMSKGLKSKEPGVIDGRFFFHLGDALTRLNRNEEAMKLYEEGVQEKVFLSKYQRSLYNVPRLSAKPWWEPSDLPAYKKLFSALKENWKDIRKEGLSALNDQGYFQDEAENLKDTGTWKQLELFARGQKFAKNCAKSPITCGIIQSFPDARGCKRGQTKFSVMHPGTHVWPHCGPTNCRLRIHLGLKVPPKTFIRVAEETRSWKEGELIIFDDSFEHEVWHNGSEFRLVLIVDVWHPELTPAEKRSLSSI